MKEFPIKNWVLSVGGPEFRRDPFVGYDKTRMAWPFADTLALTSHANDRDFPRP
jgi:hypothetical protein